MGDRKTLPGASAMSPPRPDVRYVYETIWGNEEPRMAARLEQSLAPRGPDGLLI